MGRVYQGAYELCVLHVDWMLLLRAAPLLLGAWMSGSGVDGPTFIDMAADNLLFISILAAVCCSWLSKEVLFLLARFTAIIVVVVYATFILYSFQFVSLLLPLLLHLRRRHCYYCLLLALKHAPFEFALKAVVGNKKGAYIPTYILTI